MNKNYKGIVADITEKTDMVALADGLVTYADCGKTGVNRNAIVVGSTGCGKTTSITEPMMLHTFDSSIVVPVSKRILAKRYAAMFQKRGYKTYTLDYVDPARGNCGYDPMEYVKTTEDAIELAKQLGNYDEKKMPNDRYWEQSSESAIAAILLLVKRNAEYAGKKAKFRDVIELLKSIDYETLDEDNLKLNIAYLFDEAEKSFPDNTASELIKTIRILPARTAACMLGSIRSAVQNFFSDNVLKIVSMEERVNLDQLGEEKTAVFVITNPFNETCNRFINIMYGQMFRTLFEQAENSEKGHLNIPVHVICDDFACSTKIEGFERYISIFRQAWISVTMLLQSESQLKSLYGEYEGITIINNADTYIFMGSQEVETVNAVSRKMNVPFDKVMFMEPERIMVLRRGCKPYFGKRYQTYEDPVYRKMHTEKQEVKA
ncbi:MAG: type IV secretory system conjugative DNA transfer family protein [Lachnospiraceae bacterium]|nr:type IV secretory system conjugative DNA transfer family protein [Lachnospiraceae bacterium]